MNGSVKDGNTTGKGASTEEEEEKEEDAETVLLDVLVSFSIVVAATLAFNAAQFYLVPWKIRAALLLATEVSMELQGGRGVREGSEQGEKRSVAAGAGSEL